MGKQLLYMILFLTSALFVSCTADHVEEGKGSYMQLNTRAGEDSGSDMPCFIFWRETDYNSSGFSTTPDNPYAYSFPTGVIDSYQAIKYNTMKTYPPNVERVYAVGIAPGNLVPDPNTNWKSFDIPVSMAGVTDIQSASAIVGSAQSKFSQPLKFKHQLAKLEFKGYCGATMVESAERFIDVKDIKITIRSDVNDQYKWFPRLLIWNHGGVGVGQYKVEAYTTVMQPASPIAAQVSSSDPFPGMVLIGKEDNSEGKAKPIGNFYLVPGFDKITVKIEATYIDSTQDGMSGNGQEIIRVWNEMIIGNIHSNVGDPTEIGTSYTIYLGFERSKIVVGVTLKDWENEIIS